MRQVNSLNHTRWECKYHIVFIPKYRKKVLFGQVRKELGEVFHRLARQKESLIEEGHLMSDHVHMMISIPPKYAVSQVVGFIKGKSAIHIARTYIPLRAAHKTKAPGFAGGYLLIEFTDLHVGAYCIVTKSSKISPSKPVSRTMSLYVLFSS